MSMYLILSLLGLAAASEETCSPGSSCTDSEASASLHLLQTNLAVQAAAADKKQIQLHSISNEDADEASNDNSRADCKFWCANKVDQGKTCSGVVCTWDIICEWKACSLCSECPTTTTTTEPPTTTTTPAPTTTTSWQSPYFMVSCPAGKQAETTEHMTFAQYDAAIASVQNLYDSLSSVCNGTFCPQADFAGCVLRIAGHDFMDYKGDASADEKGGSDGCIDLEDPDNLGLAECIYEGEHDKSLAQVYSDFCTSISLADFFVISAEAVMMSTRAEVLKDDPSRSEIDFRSHFMYGRTTSKTCAFAHGRLPNPENSCSATKATFIDNMGLDWSQSAALMGVHTLGRAAIKNSGYNGWWSDSVNSRKFNNDYYTSITLKGWAPETSVNGNPGKNQWMRVDSGSHDQATTGKEMMLNTDMCLYFTADDAGEVELNAATALADECNCTWAAAVQFQNAIEKYNDGKFCGSTDIPGPTNFPLQRSICCGAEFDLISDLWMDCGLVISPKGPAASAVKKFANDEDTWITKFVRTWNIATENGFSLSKLKS